MRQAPPPSHRAKEPDPAVLVVWGLCSLVLVCYGMFSYGDPIVRQIFLHHFAFVPNRLYHWQGFFTLFLHVLLHANPTHLFVNLGFLLAFGIPVAKRVGGGLFLLVFLTAATGGALAEFLIDMQSAAQRIGASGGVSGLMGALCAYPIVKGRARLPGPFATRKNALRFVALWLLFNAVVGIVAPFVLEEKIAWIGHSGGFFAGLALSALLLFLKRTR